MTTTAQNAGAHFTRPIRPDTLQRASFRIRSRLVSAGVSRSDAAALARAVVAAAKHTRSYLDGMRALLRARTPATMARALDGLRKATLQMRDLGARIAGPLEAAKQATGDGVDSAGLLEVWYEGGGPEELTAEGRLRHALSERLGAQGPVRVSDIAHLACLWSDSQRFHGSLRSFLRGGSDGEGQVSMFLESVSGFLPDHVVPVDLEGLPGDPGLLEGLPAMIARLGGVSR